MDVSLTQMSLSLSLSFSLSLSQINKTYPWVTIFLMSCFNNDVVAFLHASNLHFPIADAVEYLFMFYLVIHVIFSSQLSYKCFAYFFLNWVVCFLIIEF